MYIFIVCNLIFVTVIHYVALINDNSGFHVTKFYCCHEIIYYLEL